MFELIEVLFSISLFVNAMLFIPQSIKICKTKSANNLSVVTFLGFNLIQLLTILHGLLHQDLILIIGNVLSLITCGLVSILIFKYRKPLQGNSEDNGK